MTSTQLGVGALNGLGTGPGGAGCYIAGNIIDTGLQQVAFNFSCVGGACNYLYDVRTSCAATVNMTTTTVVPTTTNNTNNTGVVGVSSVCFQEYTNASCMAMVGGKQCTAQNRCTHIDAAGGQDKSTLQTCGAGVMSLSVYKNTSACRQSGYLYTFNTSVGPCVQFNGHWGVLSCGKRRGWEGVGVMTMALNLLHHIEHIITLNIALYIITLHMTVHFI